MQIVHEAERRYSWMFTTLAMISISPDRAAATVRLAGHPPPLLLSGSGIEALEPTHVDPPLGVVDDPKWTAIEYRLPERWSLLLYTDGLIEGRTGVGTGRLGGEGLEAMVRGLRDDRAPGLVTALVERAEELNGGPMLDDVAAFLVQRR
jgi:serine phosphatase RsbU (regulator of sigma subunit)